MPDKILVTLRDPRGRFVTGFNISRATLDLWEAAARSQDQTVEEFVIEALEVAIRAILPHNGETTTGREPAAAAGDDAEIVDHQRHAR